MKGANISCTCDEWAEGLPQIAAQAVFCSIQSAGPEYTAAKFKFCPWCGETLKDSKKTEKIYFKAHKMFATGLRDEF